MRILWHSNAPWSGVGYGQQTAIFTPRLKRLGHDMSISGFYGLEGAMIVGRDEIPVFPRHADPYGNDVLETHARRVFGDPLDGLVITLLDIWVMRADVLRELRVGAWVPVDHDPCQPPSLRTLRESGAVPIAMSRFGEAKLREAGLDPLYVPHGFEADRYSPQDRDTSKDRLKFPRDAFVVGMVAANKGNSPPRKAFPQVLAAFARFAKRHDDAWLYLHTDAEGTYQGVNILELVDHFDLHKRVRFCDQYQYVLAFPLDYMASAYSAMDVLVNPSYGEGFGIPIIEAQACGTPVIVGGWTSMPELCGAGWEVTGHPYWTPLGSYQFMPDETSIYDALEVAYSHRDDEALRGKAVTFAADYEADVITDRYWAPVLDELKERVGL